MAKQMQTQRIIRFEGDKQIVEILLQDAVAIPDPTATTAGGVKLGAALADPAVLTATKDTPVANLDNIQVDYNDTIAKYNLLLDDVTALRKTVADLITQLKNKTLPT